MDIVSERSKSRKLNVGLSHRVGNRRCFSAGEIGADDTCQSGRDQHVRRQMQRMHPTTCQTRHTPHTTLTLEFAT